MTTPDSISLSMRLKAVRRHLGETQKTMSTRMGLGVNTWQGYEVEGRPPKSEILIRLLDLGYDMNWLLSGQGTMLLSKTPVAVPDTDLLRRVEILEDAVAVLSERAAPAVVANDVPIDPHERAIWVAAKLKLKGLSFASIARSRGVHCNGVRRALYTPSYPSELAIAEALGLSVADLFPERHSLDDTP